MDQPGDEPAKIDRAPETMREGAPKAAPFDVPRPDSVVSVIAPAPVVDAPKIAKRPSEDGPKTDASEPLAAKPAAAPSDALLDAVVALVHKEPDSLSVFTSGSAFIHGVASHDEEAVSKPGPNSGAQARPLRRGAAASDAAPVAFGEHAAHRRGGAAQRADEQPERDRRIPTRRDARRRPLPGPVPAPAPSPRGRARPRAHHR